MTQFKRHLVPVVALLVVLTAVNAGCFTTPVPEKPAQPAAAPVINSFIASPVAVKTGERATLSWDVSGAAKVSLEPGVGNVGVSGSLQVSPATTTRYTLTATSEAGSMMASLTVTVAPAAAGKPDLVITDMWLEAEIIYYKIRNQGGTKAEPSRSYLYVGGYKVDDDYVDTLEVGQETTHGFRRYAYRGNFVIRQGVIEYLPVWVEVIEPGG